MPFTKHIGSFAFAFSSHSIVVPKTKQNEEKGTERKAIKGVKWKQTSSSSTEVGDSAEPSSFVSLFATITNPNSPKMVTISEKNKSKIPTNCRVHIGDFILLTINRMVPFQNAYCYNAISQEK